MRRQLRYRSRHRLVGKIGSLLKDGSLRHCLTQSDESPVDNDTEVEVGEPSASVKRPSINSPSIQDEEGARHLARLEALAEAVRKWLADPRYFTEQYVIRALRELDR